MKTILVGSSYFFKDIEGFKSKDIDRVVFEKFPIGFKVVRQTSGSGSCLFEWKKMKPEEFIAFHLKSKVPMSVGKFLVPEVCDEIGFTLEHLKELEPVFDKLDDKHKYEKVIYDAYMTNGKMELTDEQRTAAYEIYKSSRVKEEAEEETVQE